MSNSFLLSRNPPIEITLGTSKKGIPVKEIVWITSLVRLKIVFGAFLKFKRAASTTTRNFATSILTESRRGI